MQVTTGSTTQVERVKHAILLYETFATVHQVSLQDGQQPAIQPGVLATKDGLMTALRELLPESERGTGLLDETILATGVDHMVWWVKPTKRQMWFSCQELGGERTATIPQPGLVMVACPSGWYVFAVKGKDRPTSDTPLYQAPYFNVWAGGKICTGTAKTPRGVHRKKPTAWEDAFFGSYFTHPNVRAPEKLVARGGAYKFWTAALDGRFAKFPEGMLVDAGGTLKSMYDKLILKG